MSLSKKSSLQKSNNLWDGIGGKTPKPPTQTWINVISSLGMSSHNTLF